MQLTKTRSCFRYQNLVMLLTLQLQLLQECVHQKSRKLPSHLQMCWWKGINKKPLSLAIHLMFKTYLPKRLSSMMAQLTDWKSPETFNSKNRYKMKKIHLFISKKLKQHYLEVRLAQKIRTIIANVCERLQGLTSNLTNRTS